MKLVVALLSSVIVISAQGLSSALQEWEASAPLDAFSSWDAILGMTANDHDCPLERVVVYSKDGTAKLFPVEEGILNSTGELGVVVQTPSAFQLASGGDHLMYANFYHCSYVFMISESEDGLASTLYEYDSDLALVDEHTIPFVPEYVSNLWNGYSFTYSIGRIAFAVADEHHVWMMNKCPPSYLNPYAESATYTSNLTVSDASIIGNPLVVDGDFENGSMLIVPTDVGLRSFDIDIVKSEISAIILDISIGEPRWLGEYSVDGGDIVPISGDHTITFPYPYQPTTEIGKECVALAAQDSRVVAYDRETGDVMWSKMINIPSVGAFEIDGLHPSPDYLLVAGSDGQRGYLVALKPETGEIAWDGKAIGVTDGLILGSPEYVLGRPCYVLSSESEKVYVYDVNLQSRFVYDLSDVGLSCTPKYLGNILISAAFSGNYIGTVTNAPELRMYPFTDYTEFSDDWVNYEPGGGSGDGPDILPADDEPWLSILAVVVAAMIAIPFVLYLLLKRRGKDSI